MCINCKTGGKPIAAVWWRVSTEAQLELSPESQVSASQQALEKQGFEVPQSRIIGNEWHSLATLECPEMQTLLSWIRNDEVHAVGMLNSDRLSGNMAEKLVIMDIGEKNDVALVSVQNPIESGPDGQLLETVRTYAKYIAVIRAQEGSQDGLRDRVMLRGLPATGKAPYGYEFPPTTRADGTPARDCSRLIPDDNWYAAKLIWEMALKGDSLRAMIMALHERGIKTSRGRAAWRTKAVAVILHNPVYAGRYYAYRQTYGKRPNSTGKNRYRKLAISSKPLDEWVHLPNVVVHKPVVGWDEYLYMQERLTMNKLMSKRNAKTPYLLRGMIRCGLHGRVFRGRRQGQGLLYLCQGVHNGEVVTERCARPSVGGKGLEKEVWERARRLLMNPETILGEIDRRKQAQQETEDNLLDAIDTLNRRLKSIDDQEMELVGLRMKNSVSDTIYDRQTALLKAERTWCQEEQTRLLGQLEHVRHRFATIEQVHALRERAGDRLVNASEDDKRFILEALETKITTSQDGSLKATFALPMLSECIVSPIPGRMNTVPVRPARKP